MRITLSGDLGSGKSTVGRMLGARLGIPYMSTGQMFRELGRIRNLDALRANLAAENNTELDFLVDERTREIDETVADFIMDSRMAWHFVRGAVRVFLSVSRETAAARIMADTARAGERYETLAEAVSSLESRRASEILRYKKLYQVEIEREENYDLIVITDDVDAEAIVDLIVDFVGKRVDQKYWIPKARIVPTVPVPAAASAVGAVLELSVQNDFGFFAGTPATLMGFMRRAGALVPYVDTKHKGPMKLSLAQLRAWEQATGVRSAYAARLALLSAEA